MTNPPEADCEYPITNVQCPNAGSILDYSKLMIGFWKFGFSDPDFDFGEPKSN